MRNLKVTAMKQIVAATLFFVSVLFPSLARPIASMTMPGTLPLSCDGDIVASGGFFKITLPAPPAEGCDMVLINGDSGAGKYLIGFPSDVVPKLYPAQSVGFTSINTTSGLIWKSKSKPGRYKIPSGTYVYVANAGDDTNDGLSPSTPLQHNYVATKVVQTDFDTNQTTPFIAVQGGSTFANDPITLGGQPTGGNLIGLTVYGSGIATITNADDAAIIGGDNAELDIEVGQLSGGSVALFLQGNINDHADRAAGIYQHNNFLFDLNLSTAGASGRIVIIGNGPNGSAIFYDGPTPGAAASGTIQVAGTFGDILHFDEGGGRFTLGSTIQPIPHPTLGTLCSAGRLLTVLGTEELLLGGGPSQFPGGYASLGPSLVSGRGMLVTFGIPIAGGVSIAQDGKIFPSKF